MRACMLSGSSQHLLCGGQGGRREREGKLKSFTWMAVFTLEESLFTCPPHLLVGTQEMYVLSEFTFLKFFKSVIILLESSLSEPKIEASKKETLNSALGGLLAFRSSIITLQERTFSFFKMKSRQDENRVWPFYSSPAQICG